ncbi:MAG: hypothetical protein CVV58_04090 [Tenericutes bacterium HGW-Tenericutes-3]|nr:MAG: hypothetical protein CVV58_04090 [Tenericutes bacterium HGW-Tenericutes-3]
MANKYAKIEPKIHPLTIAAIVGFLVVVIGLIFIFKPHDDTIIYASYEATATSDFTEDHPFVTVSYEGTLFKRGLEKIIAKEEIVLVYIGFSECPSCQAHIGAFQKYYLSEGFDDYVSKIYYLNTSEDLDGVTALTEMYDEVLTSTPQLIVFMNGEIIDVFTPVSSDDTAAINRSVRDFYRDAIAVINEE